MRRVVLVGILLIAPCWSIHSLATMRGSFTLRGLFDAGVSIGEAVVLIHLLVCLFALWIVIELSLECWRNRHRRERATVVLWSHNRFRMTLLGLLALSAHGSTPDTPQQSASTETNVPIQVLLSPAIAALLLKEILQRRREQILAQQIPDVLTDEETVLLSTACEIAASNSGHELNGSLDETIPIVSRLLTAVERPQFVSDSQSGGMEPSLVVHVYGYPEVRSVRGERAEFRKKRALELVVWLSLNRDRPRRSAARTALWQVDVNDSTFSTIVSDMRRGIANVEPSVDRSTLVPTTYSDELALSPCVVTDYDLLVHALRIFREDHCEWQQLHDVLRSVRDAPFSGTAYEWADLDGTTTRLIITAIQAAQELAEYAVSINDADLMMTAVSAGLRVMPGCEELLHIQQSFIPQTQMSR